MKLIEPPSATEEIELSSQLSPSRLDRHSPSSSAQFNEISNDKKKEKNLF
jgi:hypothetical protein